MIEKSGEKTRLSIFSRIYLKYQIINIRFFHFNDCSDQLFSFIL